METKTRLEYEQYLAGYNGLIAPLSFEKWLNNEKLNPILKETSTEIKRQRQSEMVEFSEIEKILSNLPFSSDIAYKTIGLSHRAHSDDKSKNKARKVTKYALLGLLAEQDQSYQFSFDELTILFTAMLHLDSTPKTKALQKILVNLLTRED